MQWATAVGLEKKYDGEQTENRETENKETNYRGHSIAVPIEHRVERANIDRYGMFVKYVGPTSQPHSPVYFK